MLSCWHLPLVCFVPIADRLSTQISPGKFLFYLCSKRDKAVLKNENKLYYGVWRRGKETRIAAVFCIHQSQRCQRRLFKSLILFCQISHLPSAAEVLVQSMCTDVFSHGGVEEQFFSRLYR